MMSPALVSMAVARYQADSVMGSGSSMVLGIAVSSASRSEVMKAVLVVLLNNIEGTTLELVGVTVHVRLLP